jgi:hypothetical protein
MATWGNGIAGNDAASDFLDQLDRDGTVELGDLISICTSVQDGYVDDEDAARAEMAAALIAAAVDRECSDIPDRYHYLIGALNTPIPEGGTEPVIAGLRNILDNSETRELCADAGHEIEAAWVGAVDALISRLSRSLN